MRELVSALTVLSAASAAAIAEPPRPPAPGTQEFSLESGGHTRTVHLHVPRSYDPSRPPPLVIVLHGGGGGGKRYLTDNGWTAKADAEGFVAVAPDGLPARPTAAADFKSNPRLWNSGQLRSFSPRARIDDVAFMSALLDDLAKRTPYDARRVYVTGHSNGGGMTFRLAAELSGRLTAIATVAGEVTVKDPKPAKPLPTLYIYGTRDPLLPIGGGERKTPWGTSTTRPVAEFLAVWAKGLGCAAEPKPVSEKDGVRTVEYPPGQPGGPSLTAIYIDGHGHAYPGGKESGLPENVLGPNLKKLNATDVIWDFFRKHGG